MSRARAWHERDTAPGLVLLGATALSFLLLNSPISVMFADALHAPLGAFQVGVGENAHPLSLDLIINDALMVIFFLYVGLELKRETVEGPFKNPREAALPLAGALGGMAAPALIYLAIAGGEFARGWAIPAATDIAFAIGVLSLLGTRAPAGLRLFLLALAIIDDLGAIIVIALFYSTHIVGWVLGGALACFAVMLVLNRIGVGKLWPYWMLGLVMWGFMLASGVHATVAGVLTAVAVPMRRPDGGSPLIEAEHALQNWVRFAIMPIFALANAGVVLSGVEAALHPIALGAGLGLLLGKPIGITLATFATAALLKQRLPASAAHMLGVAMLAGIGFTMSLFIGNLAFGAGELAAPVRLGVLGGSLAAALLGLALLATLGRGDGTAPELSDEERVAEHRGVLEDVDPKSAL